LNGRREMSLPLCWLLSIKGTRNTKRNRKHASREARRVCGSVTFPVHDNYKADRAQTLLVLPLPEKWWVGWGWGQCPGLSVECRLSPGIGHWDGPLWT
jgi:hypothetical protein